MAAAAAIPVVVNNTALPAAVLDELLTRYKFIPTRVAVEPASYAWQDQDAQYRNHAVICSGYSALNGGTVYVNGEILSMLSENPVLEFDCSKETFDTVMTFVHSMHRSDRTVMQLLDLLPLVRQCKLTLLFDSLAICIVLSGCVPIRQAFTIGLETESMLLVEYVFQYLESAVQLGHLMTGAADIFGASPLSAFLAEVSVRISRLLVMMPPYNDPDAVIDPRRAAFHQNYQTILQSIARKLGEYLPDVTKASPIWDVHLTVGDKNTEVFASREVLAHASLFFRHIFYDGFAWTEDCTVPVTGVRFEDYVTLFSLLLPTYCGILWRTTASAPISEEEQQIREHRCDFMYRNMFDSDPEMLLRLLLLARHYQMAGLVDYLIDVAVHCLPWRERLRFADTDTLKSREIMASLLTPQALEELRGSEDKLEDITDYTKRLMIEYYAHLFVF